MLQIAFDSAAASAGFDSCKADNWFNCEKIKNEQATTLWPHGPCERAALVLITVSKDEKLYRKSCKDLELKEIMGNIPKAKWDHFRNQNITVTGALSVVTWRYCDLINVLPLFDKREFILHCAKCCTGYTLLSPGKMQIELFCCHGNPHWVATTLKPMHPTLRL